MFERGDVVRLVGGRATYVVEAVIGENVVEAFPCNGVGIPLGGMVSPNPLTFHGPELELVRRIPVWAR